MKALYSGIGVLGRIAGAALSVALCAALAFAMTLPVARVDVAAAEPLGSEQVRSAEEWLVVQQSTSGGFGTHARWRDTQLAAQAISIPATATTDGFRSFVATDTPNLDFLSRQIIVATVAGSDTSTMTARLLDAQNADGGFGLAPDSPSDAWDTVLASEALAAAQTGPAQRAAARAYLLRIQNDNGGWSTLPGQPSDVFMTAQTVSLLARAMAQDDSTALAGAVGRGAGWLASRQGTDGDWDNSYPHTAYAAIALLDADTSFEATMALSWLASHSNADGSLGSGTVYETALGVIAFARADINLAMSALSPNVTAPRTGQTVKVSGTVSNSGARRVSMAFVDFTAFAADGSVIDKYREQLGALETNEAQAIEYTLDLAGVEGTVRVEATVGSNARYETDLDDNIADAYVWVRPVMAAPGLLLPGNGAVADSNAPEFTWVPPAGSTCDTISYTLQLDRSAQFDSALSRTITVVGTPAQLASYSIAEDAPLADGTWYWRVRASDGVDTSVWSEPRTVLVDATAPAISRWAVAESVFSPNGDGVLDDAEFTWVIDEAADVTVRLSQGGVVVGDIVSTEATAVGQGSLAWDGRLADGTAVADGSYQAVLIASDAAWNSATSPALTVVVDTVAPSLSSVNVSRMAISPNADGQFDTAALTWVVSPDDEVTLKTWRVDGPVVRIFSPTASTYTWDGKDYYNRVVPDGEYEFELIAQDAAGNSVTVTAGPVAVKTACDIGPVTFDPQIASPGETVAVSLRVADDSVVTATLASDTRTFADADGDGVWTTEFAAPATSGNYAVVVEARDSLSNRTVPTGAGIVVRNAEVTGNVWVQDTYADFKAAYPYYSVAESTTIEAVPGEVRLASGGWEQLEDMFEARTQASLALGPDGRIYMAGGYYENTGPGSWSFGYRDTTEIFDPQTEDWSQGAPMPSRRAAGAAVTGADGKVYFLGGAEFRIAGEILGTVTNMVEVYDPATDTWERDENHGGAVAAMPRPKCFFGAALGADGRIYAVGGWTGEESTSTVDIYDPVSNSWSVGRRMPEPRCCIASTGDGTTLYVFEGHYAAGDEIPSGPYPTAWAYDTRADTWTECTEAPNDRDGGMAAVGGNGKVYDYGGVNRGDETYSYDPITDSWQFEDDMPQGLGDTQGVSDLDGRVYAIGGSYYYWGTRTLPTVQRFDPYYRSGGTFVSTSKDLFRRSSFGAIEWDAEVPEGTTLTFATRTSDDRVNWSDWSEEYIVSGSAITNPNGRYIQYRATMTTLDPLVTPSIGRVEVVYNTCPYRPQAYSRTFATSVPYLTWTQAGDSELDPVTYELQLDASSDFGSPELRTYSHLSVPIPSSPGFTIPAADALDDGVWYMRLRASDGRSESDWSSPVTVTIDTTHPMISSAAVTPRVATVALSQPGAVRVGFDLDDRARVTVDIRRWNGSYYKQAFNFQTLYLDPGTHEVAWDGFDAEGDATDPGDYQILLRATDLLGNQSPPTELAFKLRRTPESTMFMPSVELDDPQGSCDLGASVAGDATDIALHSDAADRVLLDADSDGAFDGPVATVDPARSVSVDAIRLRDGAADYESALGGARLDTPGYVAGSRWVETTESDFSAGESDNVGLGDGGVSLAPNRWWLSEDVLGTPRYQAASASDGNLLYLIGGYDIATRSTAEVIDLVTAKSASLPNIATSRYNAAAAVAPDGRVFVFGGYGSSGWVYDIEAYDPATGSWSTVGRLPFYWQGGSAFTADNGLIYLVGGQGRSSTKSVQAYDPVSGALVDKASMPSLVYSAGSCYLDGEYYVFGGTGSGGYYDGLQVYDVAANSWSVRKLPVKWYGLRAEAPGDGLIYLFGGRDEHMSWTPSWTYEPESDTYRRGPATVRGGVYAASASFDGAIYLAGGQTRFPNGTYGITDCMERYSLAWSGTYTSQPYDAGSATEWNTIGWSAFIPQDTTVTVQTRSAEDTSSWSEWSDPYSTGDAVTSPPGRYLQYRLAFEADGTTLRPTVGDVVIGTESADEPALTTPLPVSPVGTTLFEGSPALSWLNSTGGIVRTYDVQIDTRPDFSSAALRAFSGMPEIAVESALYLPDSKPLTDGTWYWRVRAISDDLESDWSTPAAFAMVTSPQLTIGELQVPSTVGQGELAMLTASVANSGAPAEGILVRAVDTSSGATIDEVRIDDLGYDTTVTVQFAIDTIDRTGTQNMTVLVDPYNAIAEADESDNEASAHFDVIPHGLSIDISTQAAYGAETTVTATMAVTNAGDATRDGLLRVSAVDAEGVLVDDLGSYDIAALAPGETRSLEATWSTDAYYPGGYSLVAALEANSRTLVTAHSHFEITADLSLAARVSVGRLEYSANDRVQVSSRLTNTSLNHSFTGLTISTSITNADGAVIAYDTAHVPTLFRGETRFYGLAWNAGSATPGMYHVAEEVRLADGTLVATSTVAFELLSSAENGAGLHGTVAVEPTSSVHQGEEVELTYELTNDGNADLYLPVTLYVVTPETTPTLLAQFDTQVALAMDATVTGSFTLDTTGLPRVEGHLPQDLLVVAHAQVAAGAKVIDGADLTVLPVNASASLASDAADYDCNAPVGLTASISNETTGFPLAGVTTQLEIRDASDAVVLAEERGLAAIDFEVSLAETYTWNTGTHAPGVYHASMVATYEGMTIASTEATFAVLSTAETGTGISGEVSMSGDEVYVGDSIEVAYSLDNDGNADVPGLEVAVLLIDPVTGEVIGEQVVDHDLALGGSATGTASFATDELLTPVETDGRDFTVRLDIRVPRGDITLAQATVRVVPGIRIECTKSVVNTPRVLVWSETAANEAIADATLTSAGAFHTDVHTAEDFTGAMRSGLYDTFVILDTRQALSGLVDEELVERVQSGATVIASRHGNMDDLKVRDLFGARFRGFLPLATRTLTVADTDYTPALTSSVTGTVQRMTAEDATVLASFGTYPAITVNEYGRGHAMLFTFDLAGTDSAFAQELLSHALAGCPTDEDSTAAGDVVAVRIDVVNTGVSTPVRIVETLSAGTIVEAPGAEATSATGTTWELDMARDETATITYFARLDADTGALEATTEVFTPSGSGWQLYDTLDAASYGSTRGIDDLLAEARSLIAAVPTSRNNEAQTIARLLRVIDGYVDAAPTTPDELDVAIIRMVHMARDLSGLSADASGARLALDEVMRYYEYLRWTQD